LSPKKCAAWLVGCACAALLTGVGCSRDAWVDVAPIPALIEEEVIYDSELNVFVVWSTAGPYALAGWSPRSSDRTDRVLYCRSSETFISSLGEIFDRRGNLYGGPAPRGLDRVEIKVEGLAVLVDPNSVTRGPERDDPQALKPAGPLCADGAPEIEPGFMMEPDSP
jgi:hypothetical protein